MRGAGGRAVADGQTETNLSSGYHFHSPSLPSYTPPTLTLPSPSHTPLYRVELEARERELREVYWRHEEEVNNAYRNRISGLKDR